MPSRPLCDPSASHLQPEKESRGALDNPTTPYSPDVILVVHRSQTFTVPSLPLPSQDPDVYTMPRQYLPRAVTESGHLPTQTPISHLQNPKQPKGWGRAVCHNSRSCRDRPLPVSCASFPMFIPGGGIILTLLKMPFSRRLSLLKIKNNSPLPTTVSSEIFSPLYVGRLEHWLLGRLGNLP